MLIRTPGTDLPLAAGAGNVIHSSMPYKQLGAQERNSQKNFASHPAPYRVLGYFAIRACSMHFMTLDISEAHSLFSDGL